MSLETGEYIDDLSPTNPPNTDPVAQGAGHLRLIKKTVQQSFPNVNGPVLFSPSQANKLVSMDARSVFGNAFVTNGPPAEITAAADGTVLQRISGALGFAALPLASAVSGTLAIANGGTSSNNAASARTALGVPSFAEAATLWDQDANAAKITNLAAGTAPNDAATLAQAQTVWNKDAASGKIVNLANGTAASDAVNKGQLDGLAYLGKAVGWGRYAANGAYIAGSGLSLVKGGNGLYTITVTSGLGNPQIALVTTEQGARQGYANVTGLSVNVGMWQTGAGAGNLTDAAFQILVIGG